MAQNQMQEEGWRHGICDCGGCGPCLGAFCCEPCMLGRTDYRLQNFPSTDMEHFSWVNGFCALTCLGNYLGVHCIPIWIKRAELREKFNIPGNAFTDCLASWCCAPCAVAQMEVEAKDRAESQSLTGQYKSEANTMNYQAPSGQQNY